ncbi:MAG: PepSY-like domain-containing protein [Prevotella sp.]|nr:PepSY-like domain-containing protein [Prevotella sp.]
MKRIFRILMIAICCMVSCNMAANAGNDKPISVNALPAKAQTLLNNHFNSQKVMLATIESGVVSRSYDVVLQNGTKLEFDKKGNLTEINCKQGIVPALLIPQAIKNYLKDNYAGQSVKKIEMNKNEYEVELTNGLDLTFNKHFLLIDID